VASYFYPHNITLSSQFVVTALSLLFLVCGYFESWRDMFFHVLHSQRRAPYQTILLYGWSHSPLNPLSIVSFFFVPPFPPYNFTLFVLNNPFVYSPPFLSTFVPPPPSIFSTLYYLAYIIFNDSLNQHTLRNPFSQSAYLLCSSSPPSYRKVTTWLTLSYQFI